MTEKNTQASPQSSDNNKTSGFIFGIIGLALGLVVGFMVTNSMNASQQSQTAAQQKSGAPAPVKGDEPLPQGHPDVENVDVEKQVQMAKDFGAKNPDYESQLKVGMYLYAEVHRLQDAKPYFQKAHELKPEEFDPIMQLGNVTFDMSQETNNPALMLEAGQWYEKALKIKPDDINVRTDYGLTFQFRQPPDYKAALDNFEKSLAVEPKHVPTLYNKTRVLIGMKDLKGAEETFAKFKEVATQTDVVNRLRSELDAAKGGTASAAAGADSSKSGATGDTSVKIPTH